MYETITLTKIALVDLLDAVLDSTPELAGYYGNPWEAHRPATRAFGDLPRSFLNPQPLPPVAGPLPDPWNSAFLARLVIDQAVAYYRSSEMLSADRSEGAHEGIRTNIFEFVDDICGNNPPRLPRPWPWPPSFDSALLRPLDLLTAGAQFQKAADFGSNNPLRAEFSEAADRLLETGLQRLESDKST